MSLYILSAWQVGEWGTGKNHKRVAMLSSHHAPALKGPHNAGTHFREQTVPELRQNLFVPGGKKSKDLGWWLSVEESAASAGDRGSVPGPGRSPRLWNN